MKITEILSQEKPVLSFEVSPPKKRAHMRPWSRAAVEIARLSPSFMSVTYGARRHQPVYGGPGGLPGEKIRSHVHGPSDLCFLHQGACEGRGGTAQGKRDRKHPGAPGDIPSDGHVEKDYSHASDLAAELAAMGDFCIGGACYPEGHPESKNKAEDIRYLKEKVDAGCSFLTTQMFFDNDLFYNFLYRIREAGISVPVVAGIMPVTNAKQMKRILSMSGTVLPTRFKMLLDRFGDDPAAMKQAGVAYARIPDHRSGGQRDPCHPYLFHEQAGCGGADQEQLIGDPGMMEDGVRRSEVFRYLGYGNRVPDEETGELAEECIKEILRAAEEKICVREFPVTVRDGSLDCGCFQTSSKDVLKNLGGCTQVLVMAATLGTGVDRLLLKYGKLFMAKAVVMQAAAAALIEEVCDRNFESWRKEYEEKGLYLRPRFSPGYGDFPLSVQKDLLGGLEAGKRLGITLTDGGLMMPSKSVTAVIGISPVKGFCRTRGVRGM